MNMQEKPVFSVLEPFQGVITVQMNQQFAKILSNFIDQVSRGGEIEKELWAFRRALLDPTASREIREMKKNRYSS